ncbi:MAG: RNB domain-containing ribonuclease [Treponema sp.]|jgi:exoribonuclease-2|nr:RNB domain-containing ribonuclease [Treponema sp.]
MIPEKSLVVYKNRPALVSAVGEKLDISVLGGEQLRVREKDIVLLHAGPCTLAGLEQDIPDADVRVTWELLAGSSVPLRELADLVYGEYTTKTAWAAYLLLRDGLYFTGDVHTVTCRPPDEVEAETQKRAEKYRDALARDAFLERLRTGTLQLPDDGRFLQDVEALAYGKTSKSRTLKDLDRTESPEEAHKLLLSTGFWTPQINPHPARFGLSPISAKCAPGFPPPDEERIDLTGLKSFAIDNAWSDDPDDAVSVEGSCLYVHVADPAVSVLPGSPADLEARGRGATLYLPEGPSRMLAEEALPSYALGLSERSPALSFKMVLNEDGSIADTEIVRSWVTVTRLTYAQADTAQPGNGIAAALRALFALAERNEARRRAAGAVFIELPEVHILVSGDQVAIEPINVYKSADMVRECMLLAGEGAARWALQRRLPFPYVGQEVGDRPALPLPGMAGSYQLRRCMRPRSLSAKPGLHWGLGLDQYTQVTSPLRRYTDLLAHQQIRAFLRGETPLGEDEVLLRLAAGEAAASTVVQAERASRAHWTAVYLADKKGSEWEGIVMEKRGGRAVVMIPALGLETQVGMKETHEPNEPLILTLSSVKINEGEAIFIIR